MLRLNVQLPTDKLQVHQKVSGHKLCNPIKAEPTRDFEPCNNTFVLPPLRNLPTGRHNGMGKPKKQCDWSSKKWSRVLALVDGKRHTICEISELTGIPKSTVGDIKTRNTAATKWRCGWPKILTKYDKWQIDRYIKKSRTTRREDCNTIIKALHLNVCQNTLMAAILELGYTRSIARRRPLLKKLDMKRWLKFAREHKD